MTQTKETKPIKEAAFKRLPIGTEFFTRSTPNLHRKIGNSKAVELKPNGTGKTHAKITFSRSAKCFFV